MPNYAKTLGIDPQETMQAMIDDLGFKRLRLVSYWKDIEPIEGQYYWDELDWQFRMAEEKDVSVSLAIGLRQPRWPECHPPKWALEKPYEVWKEDLKVFMKAVIERYKDSPVLESYQLENEFFMKVFGICPDHTRERLVDEYNFVKSLDPDTPVTVSRSNNWVGIPVYDPIPDVTAISVYKRVWDRSITKRYFEYPLPSWFYSFLAGAGELYHGKPMIIHELQAEAWLPDDFNIADAPIDELYKSMNPERLKDRIEYGHASGLKTIDLWGVEWWYQMKVKRGQPEMWDTAKNTINEIMAEENL